MKAIRGPSIKDVHIKGEGEGSQPKADNCGQEGGRGVGKMRMSAL